jgi:multicomponent Na+:H+ antiporter subunit D
MMLWWQNLPFLSIFLMILSSIVSLSLSFKAARNICVISLGTVLTMSVITFCGVYVSKESFVYKMGHFPAPWGNEIRSGLLEPFLASIFAIIMLLAVLGGMKHIRNDIESKKLNLYFLTTDLLFASILALIYTNDIFTGYVFLEICTITTCGILMIRQIGRTTLAAVRYMIISLLGSGIFLIGITLMYDISGYLLMENMREGIAKAIETDGMTLPTVMSIVLVSLGLSIKCGLFPFHFWMSDTYGYATPSSSAILSGIVSKGYIILLLKIYYRVIGIETVAQSHIQDILFVFGLAGIIVGSVNAIRENDIFRMIAFSSAAQIGYIFVGFSLGTQAGFTAAVFQILSHAVTKPLLFISASMLSDASGGSKKFSDLMGSALRSKIAGIGFTAGALSMVGIPFLSGFVTKILIGTASFESPSKMMPILVVLAISTVLNAVYYLRTVVRIYHPRDLNKKEPKYSNDGYSSSVFSAVIVCFVALNLSIGFFSDFVTDIIRTGLSMLA